MFLKNNFLKIKTTILIYAVITLFFLTSNKAFADDYAAKIGGPDSIIADRADLIGIIFGIIQYLLSFLGVVAVILIIYGGYRWMTAGGNEESIKKAKAIIIQASIGLAIILLSYAIATFIIGKITLFGTPPAEPPS